MGQLTLLDNIPSLVKASTTTCTLAATHMGQPTRVTVGGQQYKQSALITLNTATTGANGLDTGTLGAIQLWYVYAIVNQSSFALALVASLTGPTTGPSMPVGYGTNYKLVGAFYTDGSSLVGSTVNITGPAMTDFMSYTPVFGAGFGTVTAIAFEWRRNANKIEIHGKATSGTTTTGLATVTLPTGLLGGTMAADGNGAYGRYAVNNTTAAKSGSIVGNAAQNLFQLDDDANSSPNTNTIIESTKPMAFWISLQISGWNPTLL